MNPDDFNLFCLVWLGIALGVHLLMHFVTAPFGRHTSTHWGPSIGNRLGWFLMEFPSLALMGGFFLQSLSRGNPSGSMVVLPFLLWLIHYFNRTLVYPLRIRATPKKMPLVIAFMGFVFNMVNAGINGWFLAGLAAPGSYGIDWLLRPTSLAGIALFVIGLGINQISDTMLIHLRKPGETGYRIPQGFLFRYVTSPNLLGEVIEWAGFALLVFNLPGLCFFAWTWANLVPRARNHRDWYRAHFPDYPEKRKIIFPFIY